MSNRLGQILFPLIFNASSGLSSLGTYFYLGKLTVIVITLITYQGYFDTARVELTEHNIHVQTVLPGPVKSNISLHSFTENIDIVRKTFYFFNW